MTVFLTKFYTNSCDHCKVFEPIWKQLKEKFGTAAMEVDCVLHEKVCQENQIQGIPSIRYSLKDDKTFSVEHTGERTFDAISKTMEKLSTMHQHEHKHECSCKSKKK